MNLPSGRNHADYMDLKGHYQLESYLEDHNDTFPGIYQVGVGEICPNISHEVDCESLFSIAGAAADARRSLQNIRLYERLVILKHRLGHMYCHLPDVRDLYLKRRRANDWNEKEDRDSHEVLESEKEIYLEMYPQNAELFDEEEEDADKEHAEESMNKKKTREQAKKKRTGEQGKKKKIGKWGAKELVEKELVELSDEDDSGEQYGPEV